MFVNNKLTINDKNIAIVDNYAKNNRRYGFFRFSYFFGAFSGVFDGMVEGSLMILGGETDE